jgi:hypothetical protein
LYPSVCCRDIGSVEKVYILAVYISVCAKDIVWHA